MKKRILIEKAIGQTPLAAIAAWKALHPAYRDIPASYAGRLDPMASGKLLVLLGDECRRQEEYIGLDKEYDIEVLLDVGTDTGDVLGIASGSERQTQVDRAAIAPILASELGTHERPYPAFSSKTVAGKPLFLYALEGTLGEIAIPTHAETIHSITYKGAYALSTEGLAGRVGFLLSQAPRTDEPEKALGADFRIHDVRNSWQAVLLADRPYHVVKLRVHCGSGTYMRSLAARIGEALGTKAIALSIHRRRILGLTARLMWR